MLKPLEELVDLVRESDRQVVSDDHALRAKLDQAAARSSQQLFGAFGVDLSRPDQAQIAAAVAIFIINRGRHAAGTEDPVGPEEVTRCCYGMLDALNGINCAVLARHGGED